MATRPLQYVIMLSILQEISPVHVYRKLGLYTLEEKGSLRIVVNKQFRQVKVCQKSFGWSF